MYKARLVNQHSHTFREGPRKPANTLGRLRIDRRDLRETRAQATRAVPPLTERWNRPERDSRTLLPSHGGCLVSGFGIRKLNKSVAGPYEYFAARLGTTLLGLVILGANIAIPAQAQGQQKPKNPALSGIHVSGSLRVRSETWSWFNAPVADSGYTYFGSLLRVAVRQDRGNWDWQVEFAQPLLANLPDTAVTPAPQGQLGLGASYYVANLSSTPVNLFLKQGFASLKGIFGNERGSLRVGRFEFADGAETTPKDPTLAALKRSRIAHRLIGNFGFSHVGRSFDGVQYSRGTSKMNLTLLAARATAGVFQVNGWGELDTDILYGAVTRSVGDRSSGEWRVFAVSYHDGRNLLKADNRTAASRAADRANIRITSVGAHYIQTFSISSAKIDTLLWGVGQFGHWGLLDHRAGAIAAEAGFQPKLKLKPWVRWGYFHGTGDDNPNDGTHRTFFQVLPTPRIYARFPFYNLMNNQDAFVEFILRPHPRWTMRADAHILRLSNRNDLWYVGGGAFQQTSFGYAGRPSSGSQSLSNVYDVSVDYELNSQLTLSGYFAAATGRTVIEKIYPGGASGQFGYAELNWKF